MADLSLEERVHAELAWLRKQPAGASVDTIAETRALRDLLGSGDPFVAYTRLGHQILESDLDVAVKAAAASLGFLAEGNTHLERLVAYGEAARYDQRQVRRYSDRGIRVLAHLITSNWATDTVPRLNALVLGGKRSWELHLTTQRLLSIEMGPVAVTLRIGNKSELPDLKWATQEDDTWQHDRTVAPLRIPNTADETSVVLVWRGELWPKHTISWRGTHRDVASESLGNKLMLRLSK